MCAEKCVMSKTQLQCDVSTVTFQNSSECESNVASFTPKTVVTCDENVDTSVAKQYDTDKISQGAEIKDIMRSTRSSSNNLENAFHDTQYRPLRRSSSCGSFHSKQIRNNKYHGYDNTQTWNKYLQNMQTFVYQQKSNPHILRHSWLLSAAPPRSFAIPDGLVMDPLAPTALAVSTEFMDRIGSGLTLLREHGKKVQKYVWKNRKFDILKKSWKSIVNVVLIEAKDLPDGPTGNLYCKFKLGNEDHKSKQVSKSKPMWCERFNLHIYEENCLEVTVWQKGKQKNFMGRCLIDLSRLEKEKTHDIWQILERGFGSLHMLVTVSGSVRSMAVDNVPTTTGAHITPATDDFSWYRLDKGWSEVGQLTVTVHGARGLSALGISKADAYCVLELDNSRVQTHTVTCTSDPTWDKNYTFVVNDITSTLDITVYDESLIHENLGRISIPLLRVENNEKRWYALKDRSKKSNAKGNCPRILVQMSLVWNPVKASLRVLSPKESKYKDYKKPNKFSIPLIYNNLKFIKDIFSAVSLGNEHYKYLFEWDNRELSATALIVWLTFWMVFQMWMTPLLLVVPFAYYWIASQRNGINALVPVSSSDEENDEEDLESTKDDKTLKTRIYGLQDLTITIKNGIDFICSLIERLKNLANFSVPYLSYLVISAMVLLSISLYLMPVNYLFMAFGIYKFGRRFMNPDRVPNNDILDFISRVPDDEILKQWRELKVPEPNLSRNNSDKRR